MRNILTILFLFFTIPASLLAQVKPAGNDTIRYSKILLVPHNPMMHLSDADDAIAQYSEKNKAQVRDQFRQGLLQNVDARLLTSYKTYTLQSSVDGDELADLETIYGTINYRMDTVYPVSHPSGKDTTTFVKKLFGKKASAGDLKYMNATLSHPELLHIYSKKYGTDLFVFLNQFEIITHYNDCYDLALKTYRRELKVHYSVYDASGMQVYGDVAVVNFPSSSNDVSEIISKNFPAIGNYVYSHIPPKEIIADNSR